MFANPSSSVVAGGGALDETAHHIPALPLRSLIAYREEPKEQRRFQALSTIMAARFLALAYIAVRYGGGVTLHGRWNTPTHLWRRIARDEWLSSERTSKRH